jgi:hypothetical protein
MRTHTAILATGLVLVAFSLLLTGQNIPAVNSPVAGSTVQSAILSGTTSAISGTITGVGACTSATTVAVTGARTTMAVIATPVTNPGVGVTWNAWVSSNDTVSVQLCSLLATITLTSSAYNVRVIP